MSNPPAGQAAAVVQGREYPLADYLQRPLHEHSPAFAALLKAVERGDRYIPVQNLQGSGVGYLAAALRARVPARPIVIVTASLERAEDLYEDLLFFRAPGVLHFPKWESLPYDEEEPALEILSKHVDTFDALLAWRKKKAAARPEALAHAAAPAIVTSVDALLHRVIPVSGYEKFALRIEWGMKIAPEALADILVDAGYSREPAVESRGEFSVRGGIVDIYPPNADEPIRLDFFGDEIESIRAFDLTTQRSTRDLGTEARIEIAPARLRESMVTLLKARQPLATFFDWLPDDALFLLDEPSRYAMRADNFTMAVDRQFNEVFNAAADLPRPSDWILHWPELEKRMAAFQLVAHSVLPPENVPAGAHTLSFDSQGFGHMSNTLEPWLTLIRHRQAEDYQVVIVCDNDGQVQRFDELLRDHEVGAVAVFPADEPARRFKARSAAEGYLDILLVVGTLHYGFSLPHERVCFITDREVFGRYKRRHSYRRLYKGAPIAAASDIARGDYVVHVEHGVGRFIGIRSQQVDGRSVDLLEIEYAEANKLLVPVENIRYVQKFSGTDTAAPALDKLGSSRWRNRREKTREDVEKMAGQLIELYARRELANRRAFPPDSKWQAEFEASFLYTETRDQLAAIQAVKRDMESEKPMDRLVCGDVGFGKTEVAIRAVFKCLSDKRQAAILVPTTILALQHFNTLRERLADFPLRVEMLSRFKNPKEQKQIVEELKRGEIHVIIGTQRLLSKDIAFQDLGLVVVDEEQRFGVKQKERLKELRTSVDFLTLTATPIPRTLYMAISGLRDLSTITTPPAERLPIKTRIIHFEDQQIAEALLRELNRGGQVYFVHNRIHNIHEIAERLQKIVPSARIAVAHGQLSETELEDIMLAFIEGKFDILVSTTIIENGLDIPNCNTMLINRADAFGLAQLYQLRGRVGRERRRAYAYFIVPQGQMITETAVKRLAAIEEFTELGVGFNIALRDMEIRGTGNILGTEQHGNINQVGFELYCDMLEEAVKRMKGEEVVRQADVELKFKIDSMLSPAYIPVETQRIAFYKRIAAADAEKELEDLGAELKDRYGELPPMTSNLLLLARLRIVAARLGLHQVSSAPAGARLVAANLAAAKELMDRIQAARAKFPEVSGVRMAGEELTIVLTTAVERERAAALLDLLREVSG